MPSKNPASTTKKTKSPKVNLGIQKAPPTKVRERISRKCKQVRIATKAILACNIKSLIQPRGDYAFLKTHLKAIESHRLKYQQRLDDIDMEITGGNAARQHEIPPNKAKVTEAAGEHETTLWCVQNLPGHEICSGFAAGIGIDQIWVKRDSSGNPESFAIVEAKGPGATLSTDAAKGDQMSKQWVKASLEQVVSSKNTSDTEKADARAMLRAMALGPPPEVRGYVIEAKSGGGSEQKGCPDKGIYHYVP